VSTALHAEGQSIRVQRISDENGLSDNQIRSIMQDADGFVWLTTRDGLNRFDGFSVKVFRPSQNDCKGTGQNNFNDAHIDRGGTMWVENICGLYRYDLATNTFLASYGYLGSSECCSTHREVLAIYEDRRGQIWFGTNYGISKYDRMNDSFDRFLPFPSVEVGAGENIIMSIFEDNNGHLWTGSYSGSLSMFNPVARTFFHYRHDPNNERDVRSFSNIEIFIDRSGALWVGTESGLQRFDSRTGSVDHFGHDPADQSSLSDNFVTKIIEDQMGSLWVGTRHGLNRFNPSTETFSRYRHNPDDAYSLAGNTVRQIFEDRAGYLWVATQSTGVSRFNPRRLGFTYYNRNAVVPNSLNESRIQAVFEDRQGRLWVGTSRGLHSYDATAEIFRVFLHGRDGQAANGQRDDILSIHEDRAGTLWIGSRIGLSSFNRETETFHDIQSIEGINEFSANAILEDSTGALWIGTSAGAIQYDREHGQFLNIYNSPTMPVTKVTGRRWINFIHEDRYGNLWFGLDYGLYQYHREANNFTRHAFHPLTSDGWKEIRDNTALSSYEDSQGFLWIGTKSGLHKYRLARTSTPDESAIPLLSIYGVEHGIPGKAIVGILGDDRGFLWLSTDNGMARFDPVSETAVSFDVMDGLQGNEFSIGSHVRARDGRMYFGGTNGLTAFYPGQVQMVERKDKPPIVLTDLLHDNAPVENGSAINYSDELVFNSDDTMFSIEFAALDFRVSDATKYAYKLTGINSDWIITDNNNRRATYGGLQPGKYLFQVTGVDDTGIWEDSAAAVQISVLPPYWMTWWAYMIYALAATLMVLLLIRIRTQALTRRAELLEHRVQARTRQIKENEQLIQHQADRVEELLRLKEKLFTNISHEFRTPLTLILGPIERMLRQAKDTNSATHLRMVKKNGQRLLRLVDQLLSLSRLSAEEPVTQSAQPLLPMVKTIVDSFQPLAEEKRIQLDVVDGEDLWVNCAPDALEKILLNLVSNAIKYTLDGGRINVRVASADNDMVRLSVVDSGIGIDPENHQSVFERFYRVNGGESAPGAGLGLALVKELTESYGGSIELESSPGQGTTVNVLLPRHTVEPLEEMSLSPRVETQSIPLEVAVAIPPVNSLSSRHNGPGNGQGNGGGNGQESLLIVEDNLDMQEYLVSLLSESYHCQVATDGEEGVSFALESIPDLVLCDVMLPKMDGFKVSETLKTNQLTSHIPIVMLTGRGDSDSRLKGLREHVDDYLTKPFNDEELSLRIANLLAARDAMKRKFSRQLFDGSEAGSDMGAKDLQFLNKLQSVLESHYEDPEFRVDRMSVEMAMSDRQLQRKLKAIVDHSPAEYLRSFRLNMAIRQLKQGRQVGLVAEAVGFSSQAYFASCFKAEFGATPSEYQQRLN
jgi:signal transduction histidine kinase/ligand-binding sensor domain-containing protein/DNA-binding response OmpR family regulator